MSHTARTWLLFALCLTVALAGLGWITATTLDLDRARRDAEQQAVVEEHTRLALWRLDSDILPILMEENARPYYQYSPQYHVTRNPADANDLGRDLDTVLNASPLVEQEVPYRCVYFQVDPQGNVISPQLPGVVNKQVDTQSPAQANPNLEKQILYFNELQDQAQLQKVAQAIPDDSTDDNNRQEVQKRIDAPNPAPNAPADDPSPKGKAYQEQLNLSDYQARSSLNKLTKSSSYDQNSAPNIAPSQAWSPNNNSSNNSPQIEQSPANAAGQSMNSAAAAGQAPPHSPRTTPVPDNTNGQNQAGQTQDPPVQSAASPQVDLVTTESLTPPNPSANSPANPPADPPNSSPDGQQLARLPDQAAGPHPAQQPAQLSGQQRGPQSGQQAGQQPPQQSGQAGPAVQPATPLAHIYTDNNWYQPTTNRTDPAQVGTITPLWRNDRLLLTRKVTVARQEFVQGVWLDWPALQQKLLADIADLLPNAQLLPVGAAPAAAPGDTMPTAAEHRLALLPVRLQPGSLPLAEAPGLTTVERVLLIAWLAIALAALAAAALLRGVVALSERRAAFVSAVTHELRTPLTTFRLYTEMLGAGMVRDEEKKTKYLATLRAEAVRLGHLVENVLAYARLERGGHHNPRAGRMEPTSVADLIARVQPHLTERAGQARMALHLDRGDDATAAAILTTDPAAVEQILFNLVDNACKYGRTPDDATGSNPAVPADAEPASTTHDAGSIDLTARLEPRHLCLTVRDHGGGIPADQQPRLFQPFSRSAEIAANTPTRTPGVGLGLALCRRLAHALGGELHWRADITTGAAFELRLPRA